MKINIEDLIEQCVYSKQWRGKEDLANAIRQWWENNAQHSPSLHHMTEDVDDGWGTIRSKCELKHMCGMHVVRPGDVSCECENSFELTQQDLKKMKIQLDYLSKIILQ